MKVLWFSWKDLKNPYAGGAEVVNNQIAKRLVADGHEVVFLVRQFAGAEDEEIIDGYRVIRRGSYHTVYFEAFRYYRKHLRGWADLVVEEVNTIPFFTNFYVREKSVLFFHQLCREIWFYEMGRWKGIVGYILESMYLLVLGNREVITISQSTKKDLQRFGFKRKKIHIISEGTEIEPVESLDRVEKYAHPTILSLGALRPMKRTEHILTAFALAKQDIPDLELIIAGDTTGGYGDHVKHLITLSPYRDAIKCLGRVTQEKKRELMQRAHLIAVTSVKEGWGLIVTEANSQGTPAVVYDVDGLRDSVKDRETGLICEENTPESLSLKMKQMLGDEVSYARMRENAWQWSKEITFDMQYEDFLKVIGK
jgi:glycosyltransferase involved in cell wall biosynthesis